MLIRATDWQTDWLQETHSWDRTGFGSTDKPSVFLNNTYFLNHPCFGLSLQYTPPNHAENIFLIRLYNSLCVLCCHSLCSHNHYTNVINKRTQIILFRAYSVFSENEPKFGFIQPWCPWTLVPKTNIAAVNISYLLSEGIFLNFSFVLFLTIHLSLQTREQAVR